MSDTPTLAQIREAVGTLGDGDMTRSGIPKMQSLNSALSKMDLDGTNAERRDLALSGADDGPEGQVTISLHDATSNPVTMYVHGFGHHSIRIGETKALPKECVEVLGRVPGTEFTVEE